MDLSLSCILLSLCFAVSWFLIQAFQGRTSVRLPPGPKPFPLVGNLFELGDKPHVSLTKISQRYGPLISLRLGQVTTVVASSSAMAKEILRNHDQLFCNRTVPDALRDFADNTLPWLPVSPRWRNLRKICHSQLFAAKVLDANQECRRVKVEELIASVNDSIVKGVVIDIGEAAFKTTLNLLSRTCFSMDLADSGSGSSATAREFKEIIRGALEEAGKPNLGDFFPVLKNLDLQGIRRRFTNYHLRILLFIGSILNQRLESRKVHDYVPSNDMLDTLINISQEKNEKDMNDPKVVENLYLALLAAGTDTTSATLEWAMAELLHNPKSLSEAQKELDQVIEKGKPIQEYDIARLPYLQAIIKETFRLHPVVPLLLPRKAKADVEIGGYIIPKGAQVLVNVWAIGRDPGIWDNPNSFMPERFLGLDNQIDVMGKNFELIPFGGGRRICPGLPLAMRMLHLMLGSLINCFDWKLEDGVLPETMNMEDKFGLTLEKAQPLIVQPLVAVVSHPKVRHIWETYGYALLVIS